MFPMMLILLIELYRIETAVAAVEQEGRLALLIELYRIETHKDGYRVDSAYTF